MRKIKKKILFGITSLTIGGAERVIVDISNRLSEKFDITIFSIYDYGELKKELKKEVKFKALYNCKYNQLSKLKKMWIPIKIFLFSKIIYNKVIKKDYDVEVAFLEGPITRLFSNKNGKSKKIVWIHNDIQKVFGEGFKAILKNEIDRKIYNKFDELVFVSKDNMERFQHIYSNINRKKMQVIYNYIDSDLVIEKANEFSTEISKYSNKKFVCVCRLVEQKAIDRLIKIHKRIISQGYQHNFFIIGGGPEEEKLRKLVIQEGVEATFHMLGEKENPYPYIKEADYFCLLSYFEGYGMVLEEAKILNKKIIITNTAARESIEGYKNSIILNNSEDEIYDGLLEIIMNGDSMPSDNYIYSNEDRMDSIIRLMER